MGLSKDRVGYFEVNYDFLHKILNLPDDLRITRVTGVDGIHVPYSFRVYVQGDKLNSVRPGKLIPQYSIKYRLHTSEAVEFEGIEKVESL